MQALYLLINFFTIIVPFAYSFHPKLDFKKQWKAFIPAMFIAAFPFLVWDSLFSQMGVWGFNANYISGLTLFHLPVEEILFFFCIPYACVFTYHCLNILLFNKQKSSKEWLSPILIIMLLLLSIYFKERLYTFVTFLSLSFLLILCRYILKVQWLKKFYISYAILLIPFFIVNGLLTGSGLEEPIVWYNEEEIMGPRLLSIPLEDVFYGMELILLNILIYKWLKGRVYNKMPAKLPQVKSG